VNIRTSSWIEASERWRIHGSESCGRNNVWLPKIKNDRELQSIGSEVMIDNKRIIELASERNDARWKMANYQYKKMQMTGCPK